MAFFRKIGIDVTVAAGLGLAAFILSIFVGIASGISFETVIIRSLVFMAAFAALGFGVMFVLKKYVPEVYGPLIDRWEDQQEPSPREAVSQEGMEPSPDEPVADSGSEGAPAEGFTELKGDGLAQMSGHGNARMAADQNRGKLGRHIIEKEKVAQYEPKIMAQAIRTMMSKDME